MHKQPQDTTDAEFLAWAATASHKKLIERHARLQGIAEFQYATRPENLRDDGKRAFDVLLERAAKPKK
jgi:hypothetical protein